MATLAAGVPSATAVPASLPAWTIHYGYGTLICGGTSFDVAADRSYSMVTTRCGHPRADLHGVLAADDVRRIGAAVTAAQPLRWSTWYMNRCVEHYPALTLDRLEAEGTRQHTAVRWGCGLTGVPADLRVLIEVLRTEVRVVDPDAYTDAMPGAEAIPVATHAALALVTPNEAVRRTVALAPDGTVRSRSRVSKLIYPAADCPAGSFAPVDAQTLAKLQVLETPSDVMTPATSAETQAVFDRVMADCPAPKAYAVPEFLVPVDVRWIVTYVRAAVALPSPHPSRSIVVDNQGRYQVHVGDAVVGGALGPSAAHLLDVAVTAANEARWEQSYPQRSNDCGAGLQLIRVVAPATRRSGPFIDLPCGAAGSPDDLRAVERAAGALLERLAPPATR